MKKWVFLPSEEKLRRFALGATLGFFAKNGHLNTFKHQLFRPMSKKWVVLPSGGKSEAFCPMSRKSGSFYPKYGQNEGK